MLTNAERIVKLSGWCARWGGSLTIAPDSAWPWGVERFEFFGKKTALDWERAAVYAEELGAWCGVIHEMCHCFAMARAPRDAGPNESPGWQFLLACNLDNLAGADWVQHFRSGYRIGEEFTSNWSERRVADYLAWAVQQANDIGLVDGFRPLAIRGGS